MLGLIGAILLAPLVIVNPIDTDAERGKPYVAIGNVSIAGPGVFASSKAYDLFHAKSIHAWMVCSGSGPDVQIQFQVSPTNEETDFTGGALNETSTDNYTGTAPMGYNFAPVPMRYGRILLTGNTANQPNTSCTVKLYLSSALDP